MKRLAALAVLTLLAAPAIAQTEATPADALNACRYLRDMTRAQLDSEVTIRAQIQRERDVALAAAQRRETQLRAILAARGDAEALRAILDDVAATLPPEGEE